MKLKYLFLIVFASFFLGFASVDASTINYNVRIDNSLHLYENITYNIDNKDVKNDGFFHYLTSVVNDPIYFDTNKSVKYTKIKRKTDRKSVV